MHDDKVVVYDLKGNIISFMELTRPHADDNFMFGFGDHKICVITSFSKNTFTWVYMWDIFTKNEQEMLILQTTKKCIIVSGDNILMKGDGRYVVLNMKMFKMEKMGFYDVKEK